MLFPQFNKNRYVLDLSGFWQFKSDPDKIGEKEKWYLNFESNIQIAVPGSWNEQLEELGLLYYVGDAWYNTKIYIPSEFSGRKVWLRIGSADYYTKLWINGKFVGENLGGYLPFEFEVSSFISPGNEAKITMLVNNELNYETIPQGIFPECYEKENRLREETFPPARFDFFPFGGIHRPIKIYTTPVSYIEDIKVNTKVLSKEKGCIKIRVTTQKSDGFHLKLFLEGLEFNTTVEKIIDDNISYLEIEINNCRFWSLKDPFLYKLNVYLMKKDEIIDSYCLNVGVREISIKGNKLLLNGEEIYLNGFGKHEDFSVVGKGLLLPLVIKDFSLMKWINANSFRTSHYPYAEEIMDMADRQGFLVIDEVPAVSLDLRYVNEKTIQNHKDFISKLIDRDYNHPSVIMWALGNEPNLVGEEGYSNGSGEKYWKEVFDHARTLDSSRPFTVPNCQRAGIDDPVFKFSDILTINRYYGWYEYPGRIDYGVKILEEEIENIYKKYNKPLMITEFGVDAIPGLHSTSDQMFTEEYQEKLLERYITLLRSKKFVIGGHVWNFADFRTPQHSRRVVFNMKGVFTRTREPKSSAFKLKKIWYNSDH
jgi:beta-glucuronidase